MVVAPAAATNALRVDNGPIKLVAMADVFPNKLNSSLAQLTKDSNEKLDVPEDRRFIGFDGYKKRWTCSSQAMSSSWQRLRRSVGCTSPTQSKKV